MKTRLFTFVIWYGGEPSMYCLMQQIVNGYQLLCRAPCPEIIHPFSTIKVEITRKV